MNLYIPQHLKKIPIIDQLDKLIDHYNNDVDSEGNYIYLKNENDSFDSYNDYQKSDPVKRFILMDLELNRKDDIEKSGQDFNTVVTYLTNLFYSVKGTSKVIEFMLKYLNISECNYSTEKCSPKINSSLKIDDPETYSKALKEFCDALLYYKNFDINSDPVTLSIELNESGNIQTIKSGETSTSCYKEFNCYED